MPPTTADRLAWGWVAHLREGGTTAWTDWRDSSDHDAEPAGDAVPGAHQLELLRRLNGAGRPGRRLMKRVLAADPVGRGRADLALVGAGAPTAGPAPVDPADLSDDELLRVACGLIARDLADSSATGLREQPVGPQTNRGRRRQRRLRYTRYRLAGDPELAVPFRTALIADGRPPGGRGAAVHVLGADLATMLVHAWTAAAFAEGGPSWATYLAERRERPSLPRRVDLLGIADHWRDRPGRGSLDVVLDLTCLPQLLRVRSLPTPPTLAESAVELARRVGGVLGSLVPADRRADLLEHDLRPRLLDLGGPTPDVPDEHRDWVEDRAVRLGKGLRDAGYPVVGDLDALRPRWTGDPGEAGRSVLDLALDLLLEGDRR